MSIRIISLAIRVVKNTLSDTRSKVRMAMLRIIGQLALSGFQDRIKGWGLKFVSVQLTLSTYKLEFWVRLPCYIMETDYTEALTPICGSLTNLAERQLHAKDEQASTSKNRHVDLPVLHILLAQLLVLMSPPTRGRAAELPCSTF
ncbi:unnamed protein product [Rangifer tarandus platyrhynchus]|uniref:MROH2B-like HEAT-repeats domain-containing protein n=1 Tax=Rangifer tarandus platyrhynchus TaxID=3082113 RepID=A0ABN8XQT1_RANTA|nr:unnamed protein product [Rangifer tarandus platyrhynchus]